MTKSKSLFLAALASVALLFAGSASASTTTGYITITFVKFNTAGNMILGSNSTWPNSEGCGNNTAIVITSNSSTDLMMTALYDAYANGDQVSFVLSGCAAVGSVSYPAIVNFIVQKS